MHNLFISPNYGFLLSFLCSFLLRNSSSTRSFRGETIRLFLIMVTIIGGLYVERGACGCLVLFIL
ncbi:hypothetical protein F4811DRAFT_512287 [Daldinia bambusicola]|nr:hypothetical protein F4811DRAFT_512287 [Daldinia bambusicola]